MNKNNSITLAPVLANSIKPPPTYRRRQVLDNFHVDNNWAQGGIWMFAKKDTACETSSDTRRLYKLWVKQVVEEDKRGAAEKAEEIPFQYTCFFVLAMLAGTTNIN